MPFGVKDIIDTFDMPTGYGSPIYAGHRPRRDAACVALGRKAGGVVMGKTVTAEFAVNYPGKTRNPFDATRTPGGSSSGSAAAVADFMVPLALATQTTGSTIKPGSFCGVFAYRPTFGDVRCSGIMESSASCDTVGLYARTVEDIAPHRDVLIGVDPEPSHDVARAEDRIRASTAMAQTRTAHPAAARRGGAPPRRCRRESFRCGAPTEFERAEEAHRLVTCREFALNFTREIEHHWDDLSEDLRNGKIRVGLNCSFERYREAQAVAKRCRLGLAEVFADFDVLLAPSATGEAPVGWNTGDSTLASPWTLMHTPTMNVPIFRGPNGLPVGAQVIAAAGADRLLFAAARWIHARLT